MANGYLDPLPTPSFGANPWQAMAQSDGAAASAALPQASQNLAGLQSQFQAGQSQPGQYPTFPNSFGLGSQAAFSPAPAGPSMPATSTPATADVLSRGFNPWSLQGEAMAR